MMPLSYFHCAESVSNCRDPGYPVRWFGCFPPKLVPNLAFDSVCIVHIPQRRPVPIIYQGGCILTLQTWCYLYEIQNHLPENTKENLDLDGPSHVG